MPSCKVHRPPADNRVARGRRFEELAAQFYQEHKFRICERNWRAGAREIDLIVRRDNLLVFVEVKSSQTPAFGHPAQWVDARKVAHLTAAARQYLVDKEITGCDLRFDLVTFSNGKMEFYPDAFMAAE